MFTKNNNIKVKHEIDRKIEKIEKNRKNKHLFSL